MKSLHFLLRYSDKLTGVDTIAEHLAIIEQRGSVWIGKFGVGMNQNFVTLAQEHIQKNEVCWLYLMHGSKFTAKANIIDVVTGGSSTSEILSKDPILTPAYYRNKKCSIWFKLSDISPIPDGEQKHLWLYNNPSSHPSSAGMRGLIYLTYNDQPLKTPNKDKSTNTRIKPPIYTEGLFD